MTALLLLIAPLAFAPTDPPPVSRAPFTMPVEPWATGTCWWTWDGYRWDFVPEQFTCSPGSLCSPPPYKGLYSGQPAEVACTDAPFRAPVPADAPAQMPGKKE